MRIRAFRDAARVLLPAVLIASVTAGPARASNGAQREPGSIRASVDQRIELMSIVARLAGYDEYSNDQFKLYAADVDHHFEKYKNHPAVQFAKAVRESRQIAFDAVMSMAVHLNAPPVLTAKTPFTDQAPDRRWGAQAAEQFTGLLRQFYKDADCEGF